MNARRIVAASLLGLLACGSPAGAPSSVTADGPAPTVEAEDAAATPVAPRVEDAPDAGDDAATADAGDKPDTAADVVEDAAPPPVPPSVDAGAPDAAQIADASTPDTAPVDAGPPFDGGTTLVCVDRGGNYYPTNPIVALKACDGPLAFYWYDGQKMMYFGCNEAAPRLRSQCNWWEQTKPRNILHYGVVEVAR